MGEGELTLKFNINLQCLMMSKVRPCGCDCSMIEFLLAGPRMMRSMMLVMMLMGFLVICYGRRCFFCSSWWTLKHVVKSSDYALSST